MCDKSDNCDGLKLRFQKKLNYKIPIQGRPFASQKPNLQNSHSKKTLIMISRRSLTCSPEKVEFGGSVVGLVGRCHGYITFLTKVNSLLGSD